MGGKLPVGVKPASSTSIQIAFTFRGQHCRERIKLEPTPTNLKAAARHRAAILDAIARGVFDYATTFPDSPRAAQFSNPGDATTIDGWLDAWLTRQREHTATSTWADYRNTVALLSKALGKLKLTELRRAHVKEWCATLDCSNKRIANLLSPLRIALQDALEEELIETNPLYGWTYSRKVKTPTAATIEPFSAEEQAAILGALPVMGRNFVQFAFWSGLRTSELIALLWSDIDWIGGNIHVQRARTQHAQEAETTKTSAGTRKVKLLGPAREALQAQKPWSFLRQDGIIWLCPHNGEPWTGPTQIRNTMWERALKRAGVRYRNPYQTRHTYASMMLSAGENPLWVAGQMGHTDTKMIFRHYGRWIPESLPDAGGRAEAVFGAESQLCRHF